MLKNKFKIIAILSAIILALTLPVVRAENETVEDVPESSSTGSSSTDIDGTEAESIDTEVATNSTDDENFKREDVYLVGDNVTIDYIVDGNLFVVANNVTINSQIGGDAFICANTVTVGEQGYIFSNLFTCSKNVDVNGVVYDLYSASETTTINGYVYRDIRVGSNTVNVFGTIGRNAYIDCVSLNFASDTNVDNEEETAFTSQGMINGNLEYSAKEEASIPEGSVTGETTFEQEKTFNNGNTIQQQILSLGAFVVTVIVIWLLCLWLAPKFLKNNASLLTTKKILPVIGFGILTPIVSILLAILLFVIGITANIGLLLLVALFVLIAISTSIFVITINHIICDKLKIEKTIGIFGMLVASSIVLWLICLIPFVGSLVSMVTAILGLGIIISSLVLKEKVEDTKNENKN